MSARRTWSDDQLCEAVRSSLSMAEAIRKLGLRCENGGSNFSRIKEHIKRLGIDTSHMLGKGANIAGRHKGGPKARHWRIVLRNGKRERSGTLRRAFTESGAEYRCVICGQEPKWNGKELTLQIDHKNGNRMDNRPSNLRYLCPNCHSQTPTWGRKKSRAE